MAQFGLKATAEGEVQTDVHESVSSASMLHLGCICGRSQALIRRANALHQASAGSKSLGPKFLAGVTGYFFPNSQQPCKYYHCCPPFMHDETSSLNRWLGREMPMVALCCGLDGHIANCSATALPLWTLIFSLTRCRSPLFTYRFPSVFRIY